MTGMGDDGAEGLGAIKKEGGMTIAQSEESCVVYGMPKAAIERGYAIRVVGLDVMASDAAGACAAGTRRNWLLRPRGARRTLRFGYGNGRDQRDLAADRPGMICSRKGRSVWSSLHQ